MPRFSSTPLLMLVVLAMILAACGSGTDEGGGGTEPTDTGTADTAAEGTASEDSEPTAESDGGEKVEIDFWHAMSGSRQETLDAIVDDFNSSQDGFTVTAEFTGSYAETLTKAIAAVRTGTPPAIVQVYEVGTQTMLDSGVVRPVYEMAPDDFSWDSVVEPIRNYYSVDGNMHCMPFNSSTAMLYYNKDLFEEAGLDPESPPETFDDIYEAGLALVEAGAGGGISFGWPAWIFEQAHAYHDQPFANNDNGRSGLATEVSFNDEFGVEVLTEWQRWYDAGVLVYGGREYEANDPFLAGEFGMLVQSTSSLGGILESASFEVGTAFLPHIEGMPEGNSVVGGGCLWVFDGHDEDVYDGAWQFFEFLSQLEQDTKWHKETGYFAVRQETYQALQDEGWFEDEPNHATAFDQILSGNDSPASQGVLLGNFVEIRDVVGVAIERALTEGTDAQGALDEAAEQSNQILTDYAAQIGE